MVLYYDNRFAQIRFGAKRLMGALQRAGIFAVRRFLFEYTPPAAGERVITVSFAAQKFPVRAEGLAAEGFEIRAGAAGVTHILGADITGAMYGLLELAEDIGLRGLEGVLPKIREPFLKKRGIKFNLPFEPYDMGDALSKNVETCLDRDYWAKYIDFLAENRYNVLSLWSEHPYHMMFRLEKYPDTCPYSETELARYQDLYRFIFRRCRERGILPYLITWNIRITPFVAKGLGLPESLGDMEKQYDMTYDHHNHIPNPSRASYAVRQHLPIIKDYMRECIRTLMLTYEDLAGIGTNCAEEMTGDAYERQQWVMDAYLAGIEDSGRRDMTFIMRTNMGNGKVAMLFMDRYRSGERLISWKYSNAHMYSSTNPQFEKLWGAWDGVDLSKARVIYTVRNDDINTLRWADFSFIRDYVRGMKKDYVEGFYWGADAYLWASDFQTAPHLLRGWEYEFEKHWSQFWLLGRLGYHIEEEPGRSAAKFDEHYGPWGERFRQLLEAASKVIPAVNRLFWINYDFEWHPESLLSCYGFKTVLDFVDGSAMPGCGTVSIRDFAAAKAGGTAVSGETPEDILRIIEAAGGALEKGLPALTAEIPPAYRGGGILSTLLDLECWQHLAAYYRRKIGAALELALLRETGDAQHRERAAALLREACGHYQKLSFAWSRQYLPYRMARVKLTFGYPLYYGDVEKDIALAEGYGLS